MHWISHFPNGTSDAVMMVHMKKDGILWRTETGSTPLNKDWSLLSTCRPHPMDTHFHDRRRGIAAFVSMQCPILHGLGRLRPHLWCQINDKRAQSPLFEIATSKKGVKGSIVEIVDVDVWLKRWWTTETALRPSQHHPAIQASVNQMTAGLHSLGHRHGVHQRLSGCPG